MVTSRLFVAFVLSLSLIAVGCPESPSAPLPTDLPPRVDVPNPDFLKASIWESEDSRSPLREIRFREKNVVTVRVETEAGRTSPIPGIITDGTYTLPLAKPDDGQSLFMGYPLSVATPRAIWFTDSPLNPSTAHLCVLLPVRPGGPDYLVLVGMYVRGLETMEWDIMTPVQYPGAPKLELRPAANSAYKGELIFRRKKPRVKKNPFQP